MRVLLLGIVLAGTLSLRAQTPDELMRMLQDPSTASAAEERLEQLGATSMPVREMLSVQLPHLLVAGDVQSQTYMKQLQLYATLAGKLRLRSTIVPLGRLVELQGRGTVRFDLYTEAELLNDPVCRALALIGDPAVPELTRLLNLDANVNARERAMKALDKLHTPKAREAIRARIPREENPRLKKALEQAVEF